MKLCAELASCLSISIASAKRKVEIAAVKKGVKDLEERKAMAEEILNEVKSLPQTGNDATTVQLDQLLKAMADEENFMVED